MDIEIYNTPLKKAIELAGGQVFLAEIAGVKQPTVSYWLNTLGHVPAEKAVKIELGLNGKITRQELRPDIFSTANDFFHGGV